MPQKLELWRRIKGVDKLIKRQFDAAFSGAGLTGTQAPVLHFIWVVNQERDVFQRDIEAAFEIRRSSVSSVLDGLERAGYVQRLGVSRDARLKKLVPTEKGAALVTRIDEQIAVVEAQIRRGITPQEVATLEELLGRIAQNLGEG